MSGIRFYFVNREVGGLHYKSILAPMMSELVKYIICQATTPLLNLHCSSRHTGISQRELYLLWHGYRDDFHLF